MRYFKDLSADEQEVICERIEQNFDHFLTLFKKTFGKDLTNDEYLTKVAEIADKNHCTIIEMFAHYAGNFHDKLCSEILGNNYIEIAHTSD